MYSSQLKGKFTVSSSEIFIARRFWEVIFRDIYGNLWLVTFDDNFKVSFTV